jgi:hypothetical protein
MTKLIQPLQMNAHAPLPKFSFNKFIYASKAAGNRFMLSANFPWFDKN